MASRVPVFHRPSDSACTGSGPSGLCSMGGPESECSDDSQCTTGTHGRCVDINGADGCECTYDTCGGDTDCPTGQLCACHGSGEFYLAGNTCLAGNCRVDSDCECGTGYCSPSQTGAFDGHQCGGVVGYFCHTATDTCVDDSDCGQLDSCNWSSADGRWECAMAGICD